MIYRGLNNLYLAKGGFYLTLKIKNKANFSERCGMPFKSSFTMVIEIKCEWMILWWCSRTGLITKIKL